MAWNIAEMSNAELIAEMRRVREVVARICANVNWSVDAGTAKRLEAVERECARRHVRDNLSMTGLTDDECESVGCYVDELLGI